LSNHEQGRLHAWRDRLSVRHRCHPLRLSRSRLRAILSVALVCGF
jgi:hypothetical protein